MTHGDDLRAVIGEAVRRIRTEVGATADDVAEQARRRGINWSRSVVSNLEHGQKAISAAELLALPWILAATVGRPVRLADLIAEEGDWVLIADHLRKARKDVRGTLEGEPAGVETVVPLPTLAHHVGEPTHERMMIQLYAGGSAEQRAAKSLGVSRLRVAEACARLWGASLSTERDRRAGPDANQQKRARVTRELVGELRRFLDDMPRHG